MKTAIADDDQREQCHRLGCEVFCEEMGTLRDLACHDGRLLCDDVVRRAHMVRAAVDDGVVGWLDSLDELSSSEAYDALSRSAVDASTFEDFSAEETQQLLAAAEMIECERGQLIVVAASLPQPCPERANIGSVDSHRSARASSSVRRAHLIS